LTLSFSSSEDFEKPKQLCLVPRKESDFDIEIWELRRKYLAIISIIRIIMTEQKSLLWLLVLVVRVRL
jgi:hypothetical protein